MGYADPDQIAGGIGQRLRSRAFIFANRDRPEERVVYVTADICMAGHLMRAKILEQLHSTFPDQRGVYTYDNVVIQGESPETLDAARAPIFAS